MNNINSTPIYNKVDIEGTSLIIILSYMTDPQLTSYSTVKNWKIFPLRSGTQQGCPLSPLLCNIVLEFWAVAIKEEKEKGIQTGKEEAKVSLFADDKVLYIENPEDATRKFLELINKFSKFGGYKITTQKSVAFLYTNNKRWEEQLSKHPAYYHIRKNKIPSNKGTRRYKSYKMYYSICICIPKTIRCWWKKSKMSQTDEKIYHVLELSILWKWLYYPRQYTYSMQFPSNYQWYFSQN